MDEFAVGREKVEGRQRRGRSPLNLLESEIGDAVRVQGGKEEKQFNLVGVLSVTVPCAVEFRANLGVGTELLLQFARQRLGG